MKDILLYLAFVIGMVIVFAVFSHLAEVIMPIIPLIATACLIGAIVVICIDLYQHKTNRSTTLKKTKKAVFIFIISAAVLLCLFWGHLQYFFKKDKKTIVFVPETIAFYNESGDETDSIFICDGSNDEDCWHDVDTGIYHLFIDRDIFISYEGHARLSGKYWNYPYTPDIYIDGESIVEKSENSGRTGDYVYIDRCYSFEMDFPLEPNKTYTVEINCADISEEFQVMFHESEESIPDSMKRKIVHYTLNGTVYHRNKECRYLQDSENILSGTIEYSGKEKSCSACW